jgi:hypothetical protein
MPPLHGRICKSCRHCMAGYVSRAAVCGPLAWQNVHVRNPMIARTASCREELADETGHCRSVTEKKITGHPQSLHTGRNSDMGDSLPPPGKGGGRLP